MAKKTKAQEHDFIPVVDLFAGPGGLGEGFSRVIREDGMPAFKIVLSVEMDPHAHRTLELRSFKRQFTSSGLEVPEAYYEHLRNCGDSTLDPGIARDTLFAHFPDEGDAARHEAMNATLGEPTHDAEIGRRLRQLKRKYAGRPWIVIGGPPCQAYSLVGRARNRGIEDYDETKDHRHQLYKQYLEILEIVKPDIFVMENVKGILSSTYEGTKIFERIKKDLENPTGKAKSRLRYDLMTAASRDDGMLMHIGSDSDFVVRAEEHGIPQARHRVFVIGRRSGDDAKWNPLTKSSPSCVRDAIEKLPKLRSGLSKEEDTPDAWVSAVRSCFPKSMLETIRTIDDKVSESIEKTIDELSPPRSGRGKQFIGTKNRTITGPLEDWLHDPRLEGVCNHETRSHIRADLGRYLFCAAWSAVRGRSGERTSPKLQDMPKRLLPKHANAIASASSSSLFNDRFRAQSWKAPATTITSHISKDGHYFIHPDPKQVRSLTVREAARLQTFPDDYLFCGPRTEQYRQVGNAVPPLLAHKIAKEIERILD